MADQETALDALAVLGEPLRRRVYRYLSGQPGPVGRDQVAAELGVARSVAAFHLDKLAAAGLAKVEFRRPEGRTGPGAGRPAKLYRRSSEVVSVSLPERRYQLAALLLAEAVSRAQAGRRSAAEEACLLAHRHGVDVGRAHRPERQRPAVTTLLVDALADEGYEPSVERGEIVLANCPFHALAQDQRDLMCAINLELVRGVIDGVGAGGLEARLDPAVGRCCVRVRPRSD
ncbi:MAG TPA: helix-turn-helix domain-containing protein [Acidimicrobiales bacterium]|nr:helix-turn-helix domain-containing protein [Acidimicrobiales bacterium]